MITIVIWGIVRFIKCRQLSKKSFSNSIEMIRTNMDILPSIAVLSNIKLNGAWFEK